MEANNGGSPYDAAIAELETRIQDFQRTLDTLKQLRGQAVEGGAPGVSRHTDTHISHDTFFNMTIGDAAKKYLSMVKATKSTAEIADALERGGLKHSSKDFRTTIRSIIGPREDFTRVPNGDWGLTEWYGRKKLKAEKPKKKRRVKRKPQETTVVGPTATSLRLATPVVVERQPGPQARVEEYLGAHPNSSSRDIASALGIRVQTVGLILGKLKPKTA